MDGVRGVGTIALVVLFGAAGCHEPQKMRRLGATAVFEQSALEFGEVPVGIWRYETVTIRNVGVVPFTALEALGVEGNLSFQVALDPGRVMPGEEKQVVVGFRPLSEGAHRELVHVVTDADEAPERTLSFRGVGTPAPLRFIPEVLDFENLEVDSERTLEVTVENPIELPQALRVGGAHAALFSGGEVTVPPLTSQKVTLTFRPTALGGARATLQGTACSTCTPQGSTLVGNSVPHAFSFDPAPIPFEDVPVHETSRSYTRATNITWRGVKLSQLITSDHAFRPLTAVQDRWVEPRETVQLDMEYAARHAGPSRGALTVRYDSDRARTAQVDLDATGGAAQLAIAPVAIDFGELPVGGKVERVVRLSNAGVTGTLLFLGVEAAGDVSAFEVSRPFKGAQVFPWSPSSAWPQLEAQGIPLAPGADALDLRVFFEPDRTGEMRAELTFVSNEVFHPRRTIVLTGRARQGGPCSFRVLPQDRLDFGAVPTGRGAVLGFRFENTGVNECAVKEIRLSNDAGGAFFMPGGALTGGVIIQNDSFAAQVAFRSPVPGAFAGELELAVNDPAQPIFRLPLAAVAMSSCLAAAPPYLDFGAIRYDCAPEPRRTFVSNQCPFPVTVESVQVGPGTSQQFTLVGPPATPLVLQAGEGFELLATYARTVHGQHYSPLWVKAATEPHPLLIPMLGETNHDGFKTERFTQGTQDELDVLFVVSNATTMQPYQARLSAEMPAWLSTAATRGVSLRAGVTTTGLVPRSPVCPGGAEGGEAGRLFPVDGSRPRVVSGGSGGAASTLQQNLGVGVCHNLVQGLETMRAALSPPLVDQPDDPRTPQPNDGNLGLLRATARLSVVFLADEDDHSGFDVESYVQLLQMLKGPDMSHRVTAHAIVPTDASCQTAGPPGPRFAALASRTGGTTLSVCAGSYGGLLDLLTQQALGLQEDFRLSSVPSDPALLEVRVDGQPARGYAYDAGRNAVVFSGADVPRPGQTVEVRYRSTCGAGP